MIRAWLSALLVAFAAAVGLAYAGYALLGIDFGPQGQWQIVEAGRE